METLTETNSLFTYRERVDRACQSFMKLKGEYLERYGQIFGDFIATEWQVNRLDMDERLWELNNKKQKSLNKKQ